ncbi:class I SAM-dependent methyltransferase [Pyxidicoccus caerfyrddinensis]|jgi:protein arginine N-methyltransferase 1|uniref:class I SAM-dependent methyltransferase n=1 Tax=Pyxidicoccus caerfyrddinensis TaxID=2709663 RepID=UPI0013DC823A|nr:class I SAM-dependent methyltransferase [Pyxidicoccus caerfyrddinensis]
MPNLLDLPRQALMDLRSRLSHLPLVSQFPLRNVTPDFLSLSSPAPQDHALADPERVDVWQKACERYVRPGQVVMDACTGTGLRTFLAASRHPKKLYAVDGSRLLDTAQWVARRNGLEHIDFVRSHPWQYHPPEKVDVLLHELLGDALFDAGLVPRMLDLRTRMLKPGGRILPNRFEVFVEPVQLRDEACIPFIWSQRFPSVDYSCLQTLREAMNPSYFTRVIRSYEVDHLLCDPEPAFAFDLETMAADGLPHRVRFERPVVDEGRVDGFCLFYKVAFDAELSFTVSPLRGQNHAGMTLLRVDSREFERFDTLSFELELVDPSDVRTWRWQFT